MITFSDKKKSIKKGFFIKFSTCSNQTEKHAEGKNSQGLSLLSCHQFLQSTDQITQNHL